MTKILLDKQKIKCKRQNREQAMLKILGDKQKLTNKGKLFEKHER